MATKLRSSLTAVVLLLCLIRMPFAGMSVLFLWGAVETLLFCKRFGRKGYAAFSLLATTAVIFVSFQAFSFWSNTRLIAKIESCGASRAAMSGNILPGSVNYIALGSGVGDNEVANILALGGLENLEFIVATDCKISDASLERLHHCSRLKHVYIGKTNVTQEGVDRLKRNLPCCVIAYDPDG